MKLKIDDLYKHYDQKGVIEGLSLDLKDLKILSLIGASGSGKSTLLRLIAGLEVYESGSIEVNGHSVTADASNDYRKKVGFVFQDHNLFNHLSIFENIMLVLEKVHHRNRGEAEAEVTQLLDQFGLLEHAHKKPHQISGGQAQRASIARAMAIKPDLILLDEPTSSLDPVLTYEVLNAVRKLAEKSIDFIIVTHEIGFAKNIADHIVFMAAGKIIEQGSADILNAPKTNELKSFLDKILTYNSPEL
ncbi:amino acid ABC transporter ATP-binding protein [Fusibacter tunisiensis]|uniref:Polar amino acid transport system ATP-binding protein n=1 Tax=Fusibacter tunisiensis TaxID=1008308 RepID=A0ABS2MTE7_9FIRM|nr:amino acid ABC transporter ATP-binding protein [Fusibacter tunisiensis]MBM7562547.1 polar amino acid transport system ATP-binding protein [Fusibacter tunisiensis]